MNTKLHLRSRPITRNRLRNPNILRLKPHNQSATRPSEYLSAGEEFQVYDEQQFKNKKGKNSNVRSHLSHGDWLEKQNGKKGAGAKINGYECDQESTGSDIVRAQKLLSQELAAAITGYQDYEEMPLVLVRNIDDRRYKEDQEAPSSLEMPSDAMESGTKLDNVF